MTPRPTPPLGRLRPTTARRLGIAAALFCTGVVAGPASLSAQPAAGAPGIVADRHPAAPLLEQYCFRCHGAVTQTAGVNLDALVAQRPLVRNRETWTRVMDALKVGKMPPAGAPQPAEAERARLATLLFDAIDHFDYSTVDDPGYERCGG